MDTTIIEKVIQLLPEEGVRELNSLLDEDFSEQQLKDLFVKYGVDNETIVEAIREK